MHGAPPIDFPTNETVELFNLHTRLEHAADNESLTMRERYDRLNAKMRTWPRNPDNDPFHASFVDFVRNLHEVTRQEVILSFKTQISDIYVEYVWPPDTTQVAQCPRDQIAYFENK